MGSEMCIRDRVGFFLPEQHPPQKNNKKRDTEAGNPAEKKNEDTPYVRAENAERIERGIIGVGCVKRHVQAFKPEKAGEKHHADRDKNNAFYLTEPFFFHFWLLSYAAGQTLSPRITVLCVRLRAAPVSCSG